MLKVICSQVNLLLMMSLECQYVAGAFIWSWEDDAQEGFALTKALLPILQSPIPVPNPPPIDVCTSTYTVKAGDSCYSISQAAGITVDALIALNPILDSTCNLQIGQILCLSRGSNPPPMDVCTSTYTVKAGDSCYSISQAAGITVDALIALNPILDSNCYLQIGQILCLSRDVSPFSLNPPPPFKPTRFSRYTASLSPLANVTTKATGLASISIVNASYATGFFYANNIVQMTAAHLHAGVVGKNGPVLAWAFNATYGPVSGSVKASFTFNPSLNNISSLLAAGQAYFDVHTVAYPVGELRGQLKPVTP